MRKALLALALLAGCKPPNASSTVKEGDTYAAGEYGRYLSLDEVVDAWETIADDGTVWSPDFDYDATLLDSDELFNDTEEYISPPDVEDEGFQLADVSGQNVDLRNFDSPVRSQGQRGTCTAFATIATLENLLGQNGEKVDASEEHFWSLYARPSTESAIAAIRSNAVTSESDWPYNGKRQGGGPGLYRLQEAVAVDFHTMGNYIARERTPVYFATETNDSWHESAKGKISVVATKGQTATNREHGGHAIAVVGMAFSAKIDGGGFFIFKNSWGSNWGDHGYGYLPFAYCRTYRCQAFLMRGAVSTKRPQQNLSAVQRVKPGKAYRMKRGPDIDKWFGTYAYDLEPARFNSRAAVSDARVLDMKTAFCRDVVEGDIPGCTPSAIKMMVSTKTRRITVEFTASKNSYFFDPPASGGGGGGGGSTKNQYGPSRKIVANCFCLTTTTYRKLKNNNGSEYVMWNPETPNRQADGNMCTTAIAKLCAKQCNDTFRPDAQNLHTLNGNAGIQGCY